MTQREPEDRHLAVAANGDDMHAQVEGLERELRNVHAQLDTVLCAIESLLRSPSATPKAQSSIRDALEPAARAIHSGASRLHEHIRLDAAGGW